MLVGTNILIHPDTTGPGKFGRRLAAALAEFGILLKSGPVSSIFLASSMLEPHEYSYVGNMKILHRVDNTGEMFPWDGKHWTPDTQHVQYIYERADAHIFQTEWSANQFRKFPNMFSEPKEYVVAYNGVPHQPLYIPESQSYIFCSICNTWNMTRMYGYLELFLPHFKEIAAAEPRFRWMIVGKVDPLIEQLRHRGLGEYIGTRIIPMQYPADLEYVRKVSSGFIHLVYQDSCPNSVAESVMSSLPGIVLKNSGASELVCDGQFVMNDNPTAGDFIYCIKEILDKNEYYRRKSHAYAEHQLDIRGVAAIYAEQLKKLA